MNDINLSDIFIVNPAYKFRDDKKRIILTNNDSKYCNINSIINEGKDESNFAVFIHPIVAYYFSFFSGKTNLDDTIKIISEKTELEYNDIKNTIIHFIENEENVFFPFEGLHIHSIPKRFLIKKQSYMPTRDILKNIDLQRISQDYDYTSIRHFIPNDITIMVTTNCVTDCIYCYANRREKFKLLSFERIKEIIKEARKLQLRDVAISGGDIFAYKHWYDLLIELNNNDYLPELSTKVPINEDVIVKLKEVGIRQIQISLDTIDNEEIKKLINVGDSYLVKMEKTLQNMEKHDLKFNVKTVITKHNDSIKSINNLLLYLLTFNNFTKISLAPGELSRFKTFDYKTTKEKIKQLEEYVNVKQLENIPISCQGYAINENDFSFETKMKKFKDRSVCTGNLSMFWILPDGKATLCEQTYWHPYFILGDLNNQSIMDIWNSDKALSIWNISRDEIKLESPCKSCNIFEECRRGKGNCWRIAMDSYGEENYDFPAPNCPFSPPVSVDKLIC